LLLLADPANVAILRQLASGPLENTELLSRIDFISRSTYFERVRDLEELSLLSRTRRGGVPPVAECRLEAHGERLLSVAAHLDAWLVGAPRAPLRLGEAYATATVKALAVAWGSTLMRWLAEQPRTLSELERLIHIFGYRKLERILRELVQAGLVERVAINGRLSPYGVTEWGRRTAGLLAAAMRWERHEIAKRSAAVSSVEAEGVMLLGVPLIELSAEAGGTCALVVDSDLPGKEILGGVVVRLSSGCPVAWRATGAFELDTTALGVDCWLRGPTLAWLGSHTNAPGAVLRAGGDRNLAENVIVALREVGSLRPVLPTSGKQESTPLS
jgi:DNA-binding HxlR family transcriptional regulator